MSDICPLIEDTTNPDPDPTPNCNQCNVTYTRVTLACNTSNPDTCRGLCGELDMINSCVDCYGSVGGFSDFISYAGDARWYCTTGGGQACSRMIDDVGSLCGQDQSRCKDICTVSLGRRRSDSRATTGRTSRSARAMSPAPASRAARARRFWTASAPSTSTASRRSPQSPTRPGAPRSATRFARRTATCAGTSRRPSAAGCAPWVVRGTVSDASRRTSARSRRATRARRAATAPTPMTPS